MGECGNEIEVNGKTYILKDSFKMSDNIVLVRTYSAGVHFGELVKREGKEVTLKNARRVYYWDGAATLSQLAVDGTSLPGKCKFPCAVKEITLTEAIEIIPMTAKASLSLYGVAVWEKQKTITLDMEMDLDLDMEMDMDMDMDMDNI